MRPREIRIRALGGCFRLEGQPGQGTHLDATFLLSVSSWLRRGRTRQPTVTRLRRRSEDIPLDAGGPLPLQALAAGYVDVALLFTTDPGIPAWHLLVLADDRGLQPAKRHSAGAQGCHRRLRPEPGRVAGRVAGLLDTGTLRALDARVELAGQRLTAVAKAR